MSVRIVCDSTCDLIPALKERVSVTPLTVHFGDEEYTDGVDLTSQEFYEKLASSDVMPSTSQATPFAFGETFEAAVNAGDDVVCVTCSSGLSGTYQSAVIAAGDFPGKVFATVVPRNVRLAEAPSHGLPVTVYDKHSKGAHAYRAMAEEFIKKL